MMPGWWVWLVAAGLYGGFRLAYDNWRGRLTHKELTPCWPKPRRKVQARSVICRSCANS